MSQPETVTAQSCLDRIAGAAVTLVTMVLVMWSIVALMAAVSP